MYYAIALFVLVCAWGMFRLGRRHQRKLYPLTPDMLRRREILQSGVLNPYLKKRGKDAPGQALRRAAYHAWVNKKITAADRNLFR